MSDTEFDIKINSRYAEEYERKKKEEELNAIREQFQGEEVDDERLEKILERKRRYGIGKSGISKEIDIKVDDSSEDSESEMEDERAALITPEIDSQILKTLVLLKTKNADIYDSNKKFFDEKALEAAREKLKKNKEGADSAPITLKTLQQERFSKGYVEEPEESEARAEGFENSLSLAQEQRKIKQELKMAVEEEIKDVDSDDEFFVKRKQTAEERLAEEEEYRQFLLQEMAKADSTKQVFDQWASYKDNPNKDDAFLMDYMLNRGWLDKNAGKAPTYEEIVADIEEEEELDKVDNFEREYNFRFEEAGSFQITTYPRAIPGLVRETKSKRSIARKRRNRRKQAEKLVEEEKLKRQKNEKMAEFNAKLKELELLTGGKVSRKDIEAALDDDFDPATFGFFLPDSVYDNEADEKPIFDDDIDIRHIEAQQTPEQVEKVKAAAKKILDDYYHLDREDKVVIDDLNIRFKYQKVAKDTGGLSFTDIILADDKDLNQVVPMAALAPFRESSKPFKPKSSKLIQLREKLAEEGLIEAPAKGEPFDKVEITPAKFKKEKFKSSKKKRKSKA
ncbi:Kinetochore protein Spc24 [Massospora cicadina]|nr:Kinetochore protein Spc24 [Massospora cicadina]